MDTRCLIGATLLAMGCTGIPSNDTPAVSGDAESLQVSSGTEGALSARGCCPAGFELHSCRAPGGRTGLACHDPALSCASSRTCGVGCDPQVSGRCQCVQKAPCVRGDHFDRVKCHCVPDAAGTGGSGGGQNGSGGKIGSGGAAGGGSGGGIGSGGSGGATGGSGGSAGAAGGAGGTGTFICPVANDPLPPPPSAHLGQPFSVAVRAYSPTLGFVFGPPATFDWTAASTQGGAGDFSTPNLSQTTFTCSSVGQVIITLTIGQVDTSCASRISWVVTCQP